MTPIGAETERDFGELVGPHRRELLVHCYRMLGSLTDAEDVLQETLLAAWRGFDGFEGRSSLRTWLYRIATTRCLNARRDATRRVPVVTPPFDPPPASRHGDIPWLQPFPDDRLDPSASFEQREATELAFIIALQRLAPRQAAALILKDVLAYDTTEVADLLDTTPHAVKGLLQRARTAVPQPSSHPTPDPALAARFAAAFTERDMPTLLGLLTDDAWLAMPPAPHEYHGRTAIAEFLQVSPSWLRPLTLMPARANNQPAYACYLDNTPAGLLVLTPRADRIAGVTRFHDNNALVRAGLLQPEP